MNFFVAVYAEPDEHRLRQIAWAARSMGAADVLTIGGSRAVSRSVRSGKDSPYRSGFPNFEDVEDAKQTVGGVWVPLELNRAARPLTQLRHPENAVYLLGSQIGTIPPSELRKLPRPVYVEAAAETNIVLPTPVVAGIVLHHRLAQLNKLGVAA